MDALNIGESLSMIRVMTEEEIKERDNNKPEVVELEYVASPWCKTHEWILGIKWRFCWESIHTKRIVLLAEQRIRGLGGRFIDAK